METYKIGVFEEKGGYMEIKAASLKEAQKRALELVDTYGVDHDPDTYDGAEDVVSIDITHRDTQLV